jgi:hypothetical protein
LAGVAPLYVPRPAADRPAIQGTYIMAESGWPADSLHVRALDELRRKFLSAADKWPTLGYEVQRDLPPELSLHISRLNGRERDEAVRAAAESLSIETMPDGPWYLDGNKGTIICEREWERVRFDEVVGRGRFVICEPNAPATSSNSLPDGRQEFHRLSREAILVWPGDLLRDIGEDPWISWLRMLFRAHRQQCGETMGAGWLNLMFPVQQVRETLGVGVDNSLGYARSLWLPDNVFLASAAVIAKHAGSLPVSTSSADRKGSAELSLDSGRITSRVSRLCADFREAGRRWPNLHYCGLRLPDFGPGPISPDAFSFLTSQPWDDVWLAAAQANGLDSLSGYDPRTFWFVWPDEYWWNGGAPSWARVHDKYRSEPRRIGGWAETFWRLSGEAESLIRGEFGWAESAMPTASGVVPRWLEVLYYVAPPKALDVKGRGVKIAWHPPGFFEASALALEKLTTEGRTAVVPAAPTEPRQGCTVILLLEIEPTPVEQPAVVTSVIPADADRKARVESKRTRKSYGKCSARYRIIGGLTAHHQYANGCCHYFEQINVRDFAQETGVSVGSVSGFLKTAFGDYDAYAAACRQRTRLERALAEMNGETSRIKTAGRNPLANREGSRAEDE